jgi:cytoskeletal protein RodZ
MLPSFTPARSATVWLISSINCRKGIIVAQLGEILKTAREEQGLTLAEVAEATRIRQHFLEALEEDNPKIIPSPVVARGLIRNYAKYLNLDPIEALMLYDGNGVVLVKGQRLTPDGIQFMNLSMAPRSFINWEFLIGVVLGFLMIGGVAYYIAYGFPFQPGAIPATPTKTPRATGISEDSALLLPTITPLPTNTPTPVPPTDTPTPVVFTGVNVELVLTQPSWIQILADDVKVFEGVLQAGENRNWSSQRRVAIRAGNGGGVEVIVNGINRGLMGSEGQVVDQVWEKVDSPSASPPQSTPTLQATLFSEPPPTGTPTPTQ